MNALTPITAQVDDRTAALVEQLAKARGQSESEFAAEAIRRMAESEAGFRSFLKEGEDAFARGDYLTHEELVADVAQWKRDRKRTG